jgi:hypothetical protein
MKNIQSVIQYLYVHILALATITTVFVYGLDIPTLITNAPHLVKQYYYQNYASNFILDIVLFGIYLAIAEFVANIYNIRTLQGKIGVVAITTLLISGAFFLYFTNTAKTSNFFSIWFHTVKHKAIIYDIILVTSVFLAKSWLTKKLF